ncbi:MAG: phosphoribosylformylglycinamidine cyclo-ligase [Pleomorphochaeta sp.]|jgi:phosphoribosylformylglycinamidine cyclo-ligase
MKTNEMYKEAGVDLEAGYESVRLIKEKVKQTYNSNVLSSLGGFASLFNLDLSGINNPVLVSGTDGVGTKLKLAFLAQKFDTIGIDCVAMCVNDIICTGAKPLFFLDYIAVGKNNPKQIEEIVKGMCDGCIDSQCSLVGGETAEMPGFYKIGEFDVAGFATGVVDKDKMINGENVKEGDLIFAIPSSGVHSNGFSLVRKIFHTKESLYKVYDDIDKPLIDYLLEPTRIYVKDILKLQENVELKGVSHITGGGFFENIPRTIKDGLCAKIYKNNINVLDVFKVIQKEGNLDENTMFNTFNQGVGLIFIVDKNDSEKVKSLVDDCYLIGQIVKGEEKIVLC